MDLNGSVVVVTGGARGIGLAIGRACLAAGAATVVLADLPSPELHAAARQLGERAHAVPTDVSQAAEVEALVSTVTARFGPIDLYVSNAGIGSGSGLDAPPEVWEQMWAVNVASHVHAARALMPTVLERGRGYLLITASAAGLLAQIGDLPYSVTKHAAVAVAEWLAITYGDRGLTVSCLCPQGVRTDLLARAMGHTSVQTVVAHGLLEPDDVARETVAGLTDERFLILPHPEVATYYQRRASDPDRWLAGMRRLQARILGEPGLDPPAES